LPTLTGPIGVLTNHIPLLTGLDIGVVSIRDQVSSKWNSLIVTGGFALINNNTVTILVNEAEFGSEINVQEAEVSFLDTKVALETVLDAKKKIEINSQFKKARARFQVAQQLNS